MYKAKTWRGDRSLSFAHAKLDGHRVSIKGRRILTPKSDETDRLCWAPWFSLIEALEMDVELECELWVPGKNASNVKTAIIEQWPDLLLTPFAMPSLAPQTPLEIVERHCKFRGLDFAPWWLIDDKSWNWESMSPVDVGYDVSHLEGWVFKNGNLLDWQKWKHERTIDLVVTGFRDGKGQHEGFVGALLCSTTEGHEVASVGGFDEETRWAINEESDLGRVVEVKYQLVGDKGRLRHPRFVRWRDDKDASECLVDQDPELEAYHTCSH